MKYIFFLATLIIGLSANAQTAIMQPVVCASATDEASVVVPITPVITAESETAFYQAGLVSFSPADVGAGIANINVDDIKTPFFDGNKLDLSAFDGIKKVRIYSIDGKLLIYADTELTSISITNRELPNVFILVINDSSGKYTFKYTK